MGHHANLLSGLPTSCMDAPLAPVLLMPMAMRVYVCMGVCVGDAQCIQSKLKLRGSAFLLPTNHQRNHEFCVCAYVPIANCPALGVIQSMLCLCLWQFSDALYTHFQCKRRLVRRSLTYSMSWRSAYL